MLNSTPNYNDPYSPIFTDKPVYTWTDKIIMKIIAPSWNTDRHLIDSIGDDDGHFIKISTRENIWNPIDSLKQMLILEFLQLR